MKEKELCIVLGLSRTQMRDLRSQHKEGDDWIIIPSKRPKNLWEVKWTDKGVDKLKGTIGVKETETLVPPTVYKATVIGRFPNPRILQVEMHDKIAALRLLSKHHGLMESGADENRPTIIGINLKGPAVTHYENMVF